MASEDGGDHFGADPAADAALLAEFADDLAAHFGGDVGRMVAHFRRLTPTERRDLIFRHFQVDRVYTQETGPERAERLWAVLRATLLAGARYRPASAYPGQVTLFRASKQARGRQADRTMGWPAWVDAGARGRGGRGAGRPCVDPPRGGGESAGGAPEPSSAASDGGSR